MRTWFACMLLVISSVSLDAQTRLNSKEIDQAFGRPGQLQADVYKATFPRSDLNVKVGDVPVQPALALTSWVAIRGSDQESVVDGDLVLLSGELPAVESALLDQKIEITAVHNHLIGEEPQVYYIHFFGRGPAKALAISVRTALSHSKTPIAPMPPATNVASWDTKAVEDIFAQKGKISGSVLGFSFPRSHAISMHHQQMTPAMGMATAINFQPATGGVASSGDFVLREDEVNPVLAVLRKHGIVVTAVHNHMLDDEPRMVFVHFWGVGPTKEIAAALREAVSLQR
jgi:hypothetical protein